MITNRALPVLANKTIITDKFNRQYDKEFGVKGRKIGGTANVRLPPRYLGTFGPALNVEPSVENYLPVNILYQFHVDIQFNTINMVLDIDEFEPRFIKPAMTAVANRLDSDGAYFGYQNTGNFGGTFGTPPAAFLPFALGRGVLVSEGLQVDEADPVCILSPLAQAYMADAFKGLFNPQARISEQYETGMVAKKTAGFDWFESANIATYTTGRLNGTPVLAGTSTGNSSGGTAILSSGWAQTGVFELSGLTASSLECKVGDVIQVTGVYPANPQNRAQYGTTLKGFVVLPPQGYAQMTGVAAPGGPQFAGNSTTLGTQGAGNGTFNTTTGQYSSSAGGTLSVSVAECMITGGQFQNSATTSAFSGTPSVTLNGGATYATSSAQHLGFDRDAFALAFVDLPLPRTAVEASRAFDEELGLSMRMATQYTINNDAEPTRIDVAYGFASLYRQLAYRFVG